MTTTVSVLEVLLPVLVSVQVQEIDAVFCKLAAALTDTLTFKRIMEAPLAAIGVAGFVQVTS